MNASGTLKQRIEERLRAAEMQLREDQEHVAREMSELEQRRQQFEEQAARLMTSMVRPKMRQLTESFSNARLHDCPDGFRCSVVFSHTPRFPASVTVECGIGHDERVENLMLTTTVDILPVFLRFDARKERAFPLASVESAMIEQCLDDWILDFVDTYLRLGQTEQYQRETLATDPVCGMRFRRTLAAAEHEYQGHTYSFCTDQCLQRFLADPGQYTTVCGSGRPELSLASAVAAQKSQLQDCAEEAKALGNNIREVQRKAEHDKLLSPHPSREDADR